MNRVYNMSKETMHKLAKMAIEKDLSYEELYHCKEMSGREARIDNVWGTVICLKECSEILDETDE